MADTEMKPMELNAKQLQEMIASEARNAQSEALEKYAEQFGEMVQQWKSMTSSEQWRAFMGAQRSMRDDIFGAAREGATIDASKGLELAQLVHAAASAKKNRSSISPETIMGEARHIGDQALIKTLEAANFVDGGGLVPSHTSSEFISLLRNRNVVRQLGARVVSLEDGNIDMGEMTTGAVAYWRGSEVSAITPSQPTIGKRELQEKQLGILVPISNTLLRRRQTLPQGMDQIIRDDMIAAGAAAEDQAFLEGTGTAGQPLGLFDQTAAANKFNANGTFSLTNVYADLTKLVYKVEDSNIPDDGSFAFCGSPRTKWVLSRLLSSDGVPVFLFDLMRGELIGQRAVWTHNIAKTRDDTGAASDDETRLYYGAWSQLIIGDSMTLEISEHDGASFVMNGTTVHGVQADVTLIRLLHGVDVLAMRPSAFGVLKGMDWGASLDS